MQSTKANKNQVSSARVPGAHKKPAVSPSPSELEASNVAPPSEVEAKKVSPPAPLALEGWGLASYSSSDDEDEKPTKPNPAAAAKKGNKPAGAKGRAPSKDRYLLSATAKKGQKAAKPEPTEPEDQLMPGGSSAAGIGEELLLSSFDPFADAELAGGEGDSGAPAKAAAGGGAVHLRMQQRNGKKSLTTVQGLSAAYNYGKILRDLKRELCCSGIVVEDEDLGSVIQLQGDHRKAVAAFLVKAGMVSKANVKMHGS
ncbi:unnamed protein product [Urochloa decumbens]|uniref:SUI1 domain-containing protein n=1 Tax=Urochloa decumbens TaxID=240449 RepID=A0ABC9CSY4_9POAL